MAANERRVKNILHSLFSSKNRSKVIKVDAPPAFYSLPLSLPPSLSVFLSPSLSLWSPHLPSFRLPPSFLLPLGSGGTRLPVGTVDDKHPPHPTAPLVHLRAGNPTRAHLHWLPWQRGPSVHQTGVWKNLFWGKCGRINTRTHSQPHSGPGSGVKEPRFLSRQTRAKHPSSLPLCLSASLSVWAWSLLDCTDVFFFFLLNVIDAVFVMAASSQPP